MGKKIAVTDNLAVSFDQRSMGEETPYWQGRFWRKQGKAWKQAGDFSNGGCGGSTMIHPRSLETELDGMIQPLMSGATYPDLADTICYYAELLGYDLGVGPDKFTLQDHVNHTFGDGETKIAASVKLTSLAMLKKARAAIKRGKTMVRIGRQYFTYNTPPNDPVQQARLSLKIASEAESKGTDFEIFLDITA